MAPPAAQVMDAARASPPALDQGKKKRKKRRKGSVALSPAELQRPPRNSEEESVTSRRLTLRSGTQHEGREGNANQRDAIDTVEDDYDGGVEEEAALASNLSHDARRKRHKIETDHDPHHAVQPELLTEEPTLATPTAIVIPEEPHVPPSPRRKLSFAHEDMSLRRGSTTAMMSSITRRRSSSMAQPPRRRSSSSASESTPPPETPQSSDLWIGAAMYDITGPAAEVGMFGYAKVGQLTSGIHMRLRARAFAFRHAPSDTCCVYVCCDLGMISEWVTQTVLSRLSTHPALPKGAYTRENVMLSATHTHCAPGGISHYFIYSVHPPLRGADRQNFECAVTGIVEAIVRAHTNMQPGFVRVAKGECLNASVNRSEDAYNANPEEERAKYKHNTDKDMILWRLDGVNGFPIGMINWFAVHPTSMGNWYTLITGDNKGYAAHMFEKEHGTNHLLDRPRSFVAAFAQSNEGDVSPNICGPRHDETQHKDFERMLIVANAQLKSARELYNKALYSPALVGDIKFAHQYVEYGNVELTDRWHLNRECPRSTSSGCIGVSMISGTAFDGRGVEGVPEGLRWGMYPKLTTMPELQDSQKEKPVIFPTARYGLSPAVLPLQLFLIAGSLPVAAIPFEATTMAGRRIRSSLHEVLGGLALEGTYEPIVSGLSNAYSGYLTTREEYAVQRYEGASTHFGPNQLSATLQQFEILAHAMVKSKKIKFSTQLPPKINGVGVLDYNVPVVHDGLLPNAQYGGVITDVLKEYRPGSTVTATFHAAHPKNSLRTQGTFLEVHRWLTDESRPGGGVWVMHADDGDANTFFHWRRRGTFASMVTVEWCIPTKTAAGKYRIKVNGDFKRFFTGNVSSYSGVSSSFEVVLPLSDDEFDEPFDNRWRDERFDELGDLAEENSTEDTTARTRTVVDN